MTTLTKSERLAILRDWQATMQDAEQKLNDALNGLRVAPESPLWAVPLALQGAYTKAVAQLVASEAGWLEWYARENDFGANAFYAGIGLMRQIRTVEDLLWLIDLEAK